MRTSGFGLRGRVIPAQDPELPERATPAERRLPARRRALWALAALLLAAAASQFAAAGWIHAKAILAQWLIAGSWSQALATGEASRPWPWADTRPIARLTVPSRGIVRYVLEGASARSLAFGPGHLSGTASPGGRGNAVIVAHRDTHFAFLKDLEPDEEIVVETARGGLARYRVSEVAVVGREDTRVLDPADSPQLTLITCYPFEAVRPGAVLRYVVVAGRVA